MAILRPDQLTKPLNITGSLFGTSSWALTASVSLTALYAANSAVGGPNGAIQFNDSNVLNGVQNLLFIKNNNTLTLTGSLFVTGSAVVSGTLTVNSLNNSQIQPAINVNNQGVLILGNYTTTPTAVEGGFMYSGSNFFLGFS